jgi:hypothetical protein
VALFLGIRVTPKYPEVVKVRVERLAKGVLKKRMVSATASNKLAALTGPP